MIVLVMVAWSGMVVMGGSEINILEICFGGLDG